MGTGTKSNRHALSEPSLTGRDDKTGKTLLTDGRGRKKKDSSAPAFVSGNAYVSQGRAMGLAESFLSMGRIIRPLWGELLFDVNMPYLLISGGLVLLITAGVTDAKSGQYLNEDLVYEL